MDMDCEENSTVVHKVFKKDSDQDKIVTIL